MPAMTTTTGAGEATHGHRFPDGFRCRAAKYVDGVLCFHCTACDDWKPVDSFGPIKTTRCGRRSACRPCRQTRDNASRAIRARKHRAAAAGLVTDDPMRRGGRKPLLLPRTEIAYRYAFGPESAKAVGKAYGISTPTVLAITRVILGDDYAKALTEKLARRRRQMRRVKRKVRRAKVKAIREPKPHVVRQAERYLPTPAQLAAKAKEIRHAEFAAMRSIASGRRAARDLDDGAAVRDGGGR